MFVVSCLVAGFVLLFGFYDDELSKQINVNNAPIKVPIDKTSELIVPSVGTHIFDETEIERLILIGTLIGSERKQAFIRRSFDSQLESVVIDDLLSIDKARVIEIQDGKILLQRQMPGYEKVWLTQEVMVDFR